MKNLRKMVMTAAVAMTATLCAFGVNAHAAENNEEYGVIEETPDGNLIGSDSLTDEELEEILGSESEEDITTFEIPQIDDVVEYREVVDSADHEDVAVEETTEDEVSDTTDVVEDTDSSNIFVDFTDDYLDEEPEVKGDILEDATVDSTDHDDVVVEETKKDEVSDTTDVVEDTDSSKIYVDFTDDYLDEEPEVKGDILVDETVDSTDHEDVVVEETKKEDNNFFVDFTDDYVEPEEKGDILPEPTPEPEPEPTPEPEVPVIPDVPEITEPEPTPEPEVPVIPDVPEITEPESEVPVEPTPIYTPVKTSVVDEFVPQVLGDSLFEAPKTGDTFTLLSVIAGMILSFGLLVVANKRRRM